MLNPPANLNVSAGVLANVMLGVWFVSFTGANAPSHKHWHLGERVVFDRKGLTISSIYGLTLYCCQNIPNEIGMIWWKKTKGYHGDVTNNMVNNHGHKPTNPKNSEVFLMVKSPLTILWDDPPMRKSTAQRLSRPFAERSASQSGSAEAEPNGSRHHLRRKTLGIADPYWNTCM